MHTKAIYIFNNTYHLNNAMDDDSTEAAEDTQTRTHKHTSQLLICPVLLYEWKRENNAKGNL